MPRAKRHVHRVGSVVRRPGPVRDTDPQARRFATRTVTLPAPRPSAELELNECLYHA